MAKQQQKPEVMLYTLLLSSLGGVQLGEISEWKFDLPGNTHNMTRSHWPKTCTIRHLYLFDIAAVLQSIMLSAATVSQLADGWFNNDSNTIVKREFYNGSNTIDSILL